MALSIVLLLALASTTPDSVRDEAAAAFAARDWPAAERAYAQVVESAPTDGAAWFRLATARLQLGRREAAAAAYEKAWELGASRPVASYNLACLRALLGDRDGAFAWLGRAIGFGFVTPPQLAADADLASLREDARWPALVREAERAAHPCREGPARGFDFWIGEWEVRDPSGTVVGSSRVEPILDGCVLLENWTGRLGGTGKSFNLWDAARGRWQQTWVDDKGTLTEFHGELRDGVLRFVTTSPDRWGRARHRTLTFTALPGGRVRQLSERTDDGGVTWSVEYDFTYTPRKTVHGGLSGPRQLTTAPGSERAPSWSPDGKSLVYEADDAAGGGFDLHLLDLASGSTRRLTDGKGSDRTPRFSPDGREVAFWSDRAGVRGIRVLDVASGTMRLLAEAASEDTAPAWSPDGRTLAYAAGTPPETDLRVVDREGRSRPLTAWPGRELWPSFSPDGAWVALFSRLEGGEDDDLYIVRSDGSERRRVTSRPGHDFCPAWSPDGRFLAAAIAGEDGPAIAIFALDGRLLAALGRGLERATHPAWSPDGRRIAFAGRAPSGTFDIMVEDVPPLQP